MNKVIRIVTLVYVTLLGARFIIADISSRGSEWTDLLLFAPGLIVAGILLATDMLKGNKQKKIHYEIKRIDMVAFILWALIFLFTLFNTRLALLILFVAALIVLAIALFGFKRSKARAYPLKFAIPLVSGMFLILALVVPVDRAHMGSCGGAKETRMSVLKGDWQQFQVYKRSATIRMERERQQPKGPIAYGCSLGPSYALYII